MTELGALLSTADVAAILRVTPAGVRKLVQRAALRPYGRGGRGVLRVVRGAE